MIRMFVIASIAKKKKVIYIRGQALRYYGADIKFKSNKSYKKCGKEFRKCIDRHYENLMRCLNEVN